ncbi:RHS repeat domain-containing protein [Oceanicoccus sagamiensis]|uniref:RHS protein conserved region domain-containing protein n=1 Tax=Oceanicoccus sagamiensis TaxID=716816 RepID=A0A1X9NA42_9GAMM|nr:RHS repeat-associated core domain-containing protein [Oceanicoccus sagamiensis]ARN73934.1 hypothetical protein BST96_07280 [Oceanicoccus sagamiensis]
MRRITACIKPVLWVIVTVFVATTARAEIGTYYIHNDHLGTPQVVTDENQTVVWQANKKPFGETEEVVSGIDQQARFLGQYFDEESGLAYNYYRDYDPSLGRYIQSDPRGILLDFSDPQRQVAMDMGLSFPNYDYIHGLNHNYNYVGGNPAGYIDPTGEGAVGIIVPVVVTGLGLVIYYDCMEKCTKKKQNEEDCSAGQATSECAQVCNPIIKLMTSPTSTAGAGVGAAKAAGSEAGSNF